MRWKCKIDIWEGERLDEMGTYTVIALAAVSDMMRFMAIKVKWSV